MSAPYSACLVDVFGTVLSTDFVRYTAALADRAGVDVDAFATSVALWTDPVMDGSSSLEDALAETIVACGGTATASLLTDLVALDVAMLHDLTVLHDDTVPFLKELRERGVRTALVSNCSSNARPLIEGLGLIELVDEMVLSCEVGVSKPSPGIYEESLARLDVAPAQTLFVDDQQAYCDGAAALGIRAVRIDRTGGAGEVTLLSELAGHF